MGGDLDPHRRSVDAPQAEQVGADLAVTAELVQEIDRAPDRRRTDRSRAATRRVGAASGGQPNMTLRCGIGGEGRRLVAADEADVDALLERVEQVRERVVGEPRAAGLCPWHQSCVPFLGASASACGRASPAYLFSIASRMVVSEAPELCICRACGRDVEADFADHAVRFPLRGLAGRVASAHEAVVVAAMAAALAAAEARHVLEHFGMLGGKEVRRFHDLGRTRRRVDVARYRREVRRDLERQRLRWSLRQGGHRRFRRGLRPVAARRAGDHERAGRDQA